MTRSAIEMRALDRHPARREAPGYDAQLGSTALATEHFRALRLRFMYERVLKNTPAVWVIALFIGVALYRYAHQPAVLAWPIAIGLGFQWRQHWLRPALAPGVIEHATDHWRRRMYISTIALGLVVGAGPWLVFPELPEGAQMYVTLVLCCWLSGAMSSIGYEARLYAIYAASFCAGICLGWLRTDSPYLIDVLVMLPIYAVVVVGFSRGMATVVDQSLRLRAVNEEMVARLQVAKEAAESASSAKSRFLAVASHDLRQPLHALMLLNGLLAREQPADRVHEISQQMGRSLTTLERLFSSVLDFSKLEASVVEAQPRWFHLDELIEQVLDELRLHASAKGLQLVFERSGLDAPTPKRQRSHGARRTGDIHPARPANPVHRRRSVVADGAVLLAAALGLRGALRVISR